MTQEQREELLADCLEDYHRGRALGETPDLDAFQARLGDLYGEFQELMLAETAIDQALDPRPDLALPVAWGAYTLLAELGRGAAGVVYEALHRKLGRRVALKILRTGPDTDETARERFRREAQALAQVRHDHIVEIFEFGEVDGRPYYAMALVDGPTLTGLLKARAAPGPRELCAGLAGVADALHALHEAGIIHRDVKPSNIMVAPNGRYMLADFGLARTAMATTVTRTGDALGTPLYMSPEQLLGQRDAIEARTDVYGLGATLYQMLTGQPPFRTDELQVLMRMILTQRPVAPRTVRPDLPAGCDAIALKCLEKRPEDRFASAHEVSTQLRAFASGERVTARPLSLARRGQRWVQRHKPLAAAAVLLVAVGLFFLLQPPAPASLSLTTWPGTAPAEVSIDGGPYHPTPVTKLALAAGRRHDIHVRAKLAGFGDLRIPVTPSPAQDLNWEKSLPVLDPRSPEVARALAEWAGLASDVEGSRDLARGDDDELPLQLLRPRGMVRLADLDAWEVRVTERFASRGWLEFRSGEVVLAKLPFPEPTDFITRADLPPEVLASLRNGDDVTWGFRSEASGKLEASATFTLVEVDLGEKLQDIEERLASYDGETRRVMGVTLRALLFLHHDLAQAAQREIAAAVAAGDETLYLLALEKKALDQLFPDRKERSRISLVFENDERWNRRPEAEREGFRRAVAPR